MRNQPPFIPSALSPSPQRPAQVRPARAQTTGTAEPVALRQLKYGLGPSGLVGGLVVAPASHRQTLCSARSC